MPGPHFALARCTAVCLLSVLFSFQIWAVSAAGTAGNSCCKCTLKDPASLLCVKITGSDCTNALNVAGADASGAINFKCDPTPVAEADCKTVAEGGICATVAPPGQAASAAAKETAGQAEKKFVAKTPVVNVEIPGLVFSQSVTESGGYATLPYIAEYVAAFYRYITGAAVIAAALMIVYGGFLYILGGTIQSVRNGKEKVFDALIGLALVFTSYLLLTIVNPEAAAPKPLTIRIAKEDTEWLINMTGDSATYTPDQQEVQKRLAKAPANPAPPQAQAGQPAQAEATPAAGGAGPSQGVALGDISLPDSPYKVEDGMTVDEDGKKLWPVGCNGLSMVGKGNQPGSFTTLSNAFKGKPRSIDGLKSAIKEAKAASQIGTFYSRGIENLEPYPFIPEPGDDVITNSKKWSSFLFSTIQKSIRTKKKGAEVHVEWIMMTIVHGKKWSTTKTKSLCGDLTSIPYKRGVFLGKFYEKFSKSEDLKRKMVPCMNSIIEIYNNTYYKTAKCFNVFTNQCSFETYFQVNFGKNPTPKEKLPGEEVLSNLKSGTYQAGTGIYTDGRGHQFLYTGGLGLGYEVLEFGGGGFAPPVVVKPGFMGEAETKFGGGLSTSPSITSHVAAGKNYEIAPVTW